MPSEARRRISQPEAIQALAHPVRLELLTYLMAEGPATASACARAVGDSPSNCSYHLRLLAKVGLVDAEASSDGRKRPWRALITGFDTDLDERSTSPQALELFTIAQQRNERRVRDYVAHRPEVPKRWRDADTFNNYALRLSPPELSDLVVKLDALIRPYVAATREDAPRGSALVHLDLRAFKYESAR